MQLTVPCTFDRRHEPAFELTCVCSSVEPHLTHTLLHACDRMCHVCSIAYMCLRSNSLAFVQVQKPTSHTLTQHECDRMHVRTMDHMRSKSSRDLFLGHFPPSFPPFSPTPYQFSPLFSFLHRTQPPFHRHPSSPITTAPSPHRHHHTATAPPQRLRQPHFTPISPHPFFLT
jgi:hypothetical protein